MDEPELPCLIICVNRRLTGNTRSCAAGGAEAIARAVEAELARRGLRHEVVRLHCLGRCEQGPNARIAPGGDIMHGLTLEDVSRVIERLVTFEMPDYARR